MTWTYGAQAQTKTPQEILDLQYNWLGDPSWDVEDTIGFELYHYQLKAWRIEIQRDETERESQRLTAKAKELGCSVELVGYIETLERRIKALEGAVWL